MVDLKCKNCNESISSSIRERRIFVQPLGYLKCSSCGSVSRLIYPYGIDLSLLPTVSSILIGILHMITWDFLSLEVNSYKNVLLSVSFCLWSYFIFKKVRWIEYVKDIRVYEETEIEYTSFKKSLMVTSCISLVTMIVISFLIMLNKPMNFNNPEHRNIAILIFLSTLFYSLLLALFGKWVTNRRLRKYFIDS